MLIKQSSVALSRRPRTSSIVSLHASILFAASSRLQQFDITRRKMIKIATTNVAVQKKACSSDLINATVALFLSAHARERSYCRATTEPQTLYFVHVC